MCGLSHFIEDFGLELNKTKKYKNIFLKKE